MFWDLISGVDWWENSLKNIMFDIWHVLLNNLTTCDVMVSIFILVIRIAKVISWICSKLKNNIKNTCKVVS